jgi:hypothetical protein
MLRDTRLELNGGETPFDGLSYKPVHAELSVAKKTYLKQ